MSADLSRYHRQMLLPGFGKAGQQRLSESTALLLGCGALGSVSADMLARAGVGHLVIVDRDFVELTNLQRQVLYDEQDVVKSLPKAEAARRKLAAINSQIRVTAIVDDINHSNIASFARDADIIIDGLDNFETRYLANDLAVKEGLPYLYGGAVGTTGMAFAVLPHGSGDSPWENHETGNLATPCLRCLFEEAPAPGSTPTCDTVGVIAPAVSIIANFQVAEALKILTGNIDRVSRLLLSLDLWFNTIHQLDVDNSYEKGNCPCCKHRQFDYLQGKSGSKATSLCGSDAVQLRQQQEQDNVDLNRIATRLREYGSVSVNEFLLKAEIEDNDARYQITLFENGRAIVKGTNETSEARGIYAKYIGI